MSTKTPAHDAAIADAIRERYAALSAKDAERVLSSSGSGFIAYTLAPPLKDEGDIAGLIGWFATWDGPIGYELRDLEISAGEDVAFAHGLVHMTGRKTDGVAVDLWFRQTLGLRNRRGV